MQVRASDVYLPEAATFVVSNSLAVSNKAEGATGRYNLRVVECRWVGHRALQPQGSGLQWVEAEAGMLAVEMQGGVAAGQGRGWQQGRAGPGRTGVGGPPSPALPPGWEVGVAGVQQLGRVSRSRRHQQQQ